MIISQLKKYIYLTLGWISLALGIIGIFLPIMPTTPFAVLAAFLFSKGSKELHQWLLSRPYIGPLINEWEQYGVIKTRIKLLSTGAIALLFTYSFILMPPILWPKIIILIIGSGILVFIWSRPSKKND